jgi:ribosomal protein S18 acetylase RimI-like enzyme
MTQTEFDAYLDRSVRDYGQDKVRAGEFTPERADEQARAEFMLLLPEGVRTNGMLLFTAFDGDEQVGMLWLALPSARRRQAWVYELWVAPTVRSRGYGRAIMRAGERELAARGVAEIGLNVFGDNTTAIGLYESLGYKVIAQQMTKPVGGA